MAWHTPKVWKPTDFRLTPSIFNYEIRDLLQYLYDTTVGADPPVDDWIAVTFANGWANVGGSFDAAGYRRDGAWVSLRGYVRNGTLGDPMFDPLPADYRPLHNLHFPVVSNSAFGWVFVTSGGDVSLESGSNTSVDLTPIRFRVI